MALSADYNIKEVAVALGMSERWVRARVIEGAEHQRYGHKIAFTDAQVEKLRAAHTENPVPQSITAGRRKKAS